ncbi:MAG: glycoside hydrolase family 2, partial [Planctomycetaceae bacterium]
MPTPSLRLLSILCLVLGLISGLAISDSPAAEPDRPAGGNLITRWGRTVTADNAWPEYPRPQQVRSRWLNLNGHWDYALQPRAETALRPERFDGQILVPFPVESHLSGVRRSVGADQRVLYHRRFEFPADWHDQHVLLHF